MSLKVVTPSYKRADRVLSKKVCSDVILCVSESEEYEYRLHNPECEIVTHPDSVKGIIPKRNWMVNYFGDLFMLDDDVHSFKKLYYDKGETSNIVDNNKEGVRKKIEELHELAQMIGVSLYGFSSAQTPVQYQEENFLKLTGKVTGCSYGVIKSENTKWDESFQLKEDYLISCTILHSERRVLIDNRYVFKQKDTMMNPGGLSEIRTHEKEIENIYRLRKYFGETIVKRKAVFTGREMTTAKSKNNISLNIRI